MKLDILTLSHFTKLDIQAQRGHSNAGGGMASLMNAARSTLSTRYDVRLCSSISELQANVVILDPLFLNTEHKDTEKHEADRINLRALHKDKHTTKRKYIVWCAEKTLLRLLPKHRNQLLRLTDSLAVTDPYIERLFKAINVYPDGFLCDCINANLFRPAPKEMTVTAVGGLKHIKNINWIIEVFKQLKGKMRRTYLGSAALWSHENRQEDRQLIGKIQAVTDDYYPNASIVQVAYHNAHAAITINNTWHDCSSRANEELLMSGVISIHGEHPLFLGRPGFTVKTPAEAVKTISELTDDFTKLPDIKHHTCARNWALRNVSETTFLSQFENLIRWLL